MLTVQCIDSDTLKVINGRDECMAYIYGPHDLKFGDELPFKSLTLDGDKIRVEVERPISLVEAVGDYFGFSANYSTIGDGIEKLGLYDAWKREVEKGRGINILANGVALYDAWKREVEKEKT